MSNFKEFLDYCESFYSPSHPDVLYPIDGLTREELALATLNYLDLCEEDTHVTWGGGDSLDRERVRNFVIERRAVVFDADEFIDLASDALNVLKEVA